MGKKPGPYEWPVVPKKAKKAVMKLLDKGKISVDKIVDKFAEDFRKYIGTKYCIPEINGTSALYSAFFAIGLEPGDEVICPSYTYWATAMPAAAQGAKIVFAEVETDTFNIDPEDISKKITDKTKAIVPVHLWGLPCEMDTIMEIAEEHNIYVIEDASHSHGASYKGKMTGNLGHISCFSFQGTKLLPAGEAGMMLTDNEEFFERGTALGHYTRAKKLDGEYKKYGTTSLGFKFRMSPLHAAIGRELLKNYDNYNKVITENTEKMREAIGELPGFIDYRPPSYIARVYYENVMDYQENESRIPRDNLLNKLKMGLLHINPTRYPLIHQQPYFQERGYDKHSLPVTEKLVARLFRFPTIRTKGDGEVDKWIKKFTKYYSKILND
ncbi:MAG: aminotransferase class I/II-fold pyridoxal phosphate-dependent enzyme [Candidatus Lokiarchaeota archaeon]|nr:aminotransferase class I/II-fold pyridoxal phosphate-dependent enzyme [Candidatus Lokiarchaeota archaeon]